MSRWSLGNRFHAISHRQFQDLVTQFQEAAELSFDSPVTLDIRLLSEPMRFSSKPEEAVMERAARENAENTVGRTDDLSLITKDLWQLAKHVVVDIRPEDTGENRFGRARVEFKGRRPKLATFSISHESVPGTAREALASQNRRMQQGNGATSHGMNIGLPVEMALAEHMSLARN